MRGEARGDSTCNLQENSSVFEFNPGNPYNRLFLKRRRIPKENGHSEDILMKTLRSAFLKTHGPTFEVKVREYDTLVLNSIPGWSKKFRSNSPTVWSV